MHAQRRFNSFIFTLDAQENILDSQSKGSSAHDALIDSGDHYLNCLCVQFTDLAKAGE